MFEQFNIRSYLASYSSSRQDPIFAGAPQTPLAPGQTGRLGFTLGRNSGRAGHSSAVSLISRKYRGTVRHVSAAWLLGSKSRAIKGPRGAHRRPLGRARGGEGESKSRRIPATGPYGAPFRPRICVTCERRDGTRATGGRTGAVDERRTRKGTDERDGRGWVSCGGKKALAGAESRV